MDPPPPDPIVGLGPIACATVRWRLGGGLRATVVVKATFALVPDAVVSVASPSRGPLAAADLHQDGNAARSVRVASDLVPYRPRADVTFVGHAYAPPGRPVPASAIRLAVFRDRPLLDKTLHVFGDRVRGAGGPGAPRPFQRVPIVYERAYGGPADPTNPAGVGAGNGPSPLPNLVDPAAPEQPAGLGPLGRFSPARRRWLGDLDRARLDALDLPADFAWDYFQAAPRDQQVEALRGDEWLVLDGLHPKLSRLQSRLGGARAEARMCTRTPEGRIEARGVELVLDTLAIDGDALTASLVWRGSLPFADERALASLVAVAALAFPGQPVEWPDPQELYPPSTLTVTEPAPALPVEAGHETGEETRMLSPELSRALAERLATPFARPEAGPPVPAAPPPTATGTPWARVEGPPPVPVPTAPPPAVSGTPWAQAPPPLATEPLPPPREETLPPAGPLPPLGAPGRWFHVLDKNASEPGEGSGAPPLAPRRKRPAIPSITPPSLVLFTVPWQVKPPQDSLTLVVKASFDVVPDGPAALRAEPDLPNGDVHVDDDPDKSLTCASDYGIFKPKADVTVVGSAHAHGGKKPAVKVSFAFGAGSNRFERSVLVLGDRRFNRSVLGAALTEAEPFDAMPLVYERAFGGPRFEANPVGTGHKSAEGDRAPNLEDPAQPLGKSGESAPVCFAPIPTQWAARWGRLGTYDLRWLRARWPYFPEDFDWAYFQAAPPAQQLQHLTGDEPFELRGLHPTLPVVRGTLPRLRVRCFCELTPEAGGTFREIELRLDTAAFDLTGGDAMRLSLVWRGLLDVTEEEAPEVNALFVLKESLDEAPASLAEARARYLAAAAPRAPVEESPDAAPAVANDVAVEDAERDAVSAQDEAEEKAIRATLRAAGVPDDDPAAPPGALEAPAPDPEAIAASLRRSGVSEEEIASVLEAMAPDPDEPEEGGAVPAMVDLRARVVARLERGEALDGLDLQGADLSGLDLEGRSLAKADLRGAKLTFCSLRGATLAGASLGGADLTGANLDGADLTGADLARATLIDASLAGATLALTDLTGANGTGAHFDGAKFDRTRFVEGTFAGASFADAAGRAVDFTKAVLDRASFRGAFLPGVRLYGVQGMGVLFEGAKLPGARADGATLLKSSFRGLEAEGSVWENATLSDSTFFAAKLKGSSFARSTCTGTIFSSADLSQGRLGRANLTRAQFLKTNLMMALLGRANLEQADLRGANLHAAETWRANLSGARLELAIVTQSKLAKRG